MIGVFNLEVEVSFHVRERQLSQASKGGQIRGRAARCTGFQPGVDLTFRLL